MKTINIHAAKTHFSTLVQEAAAGEEIIIAKAGQPMARLAPLEKKNVRKTLGMLKGKIRGGEDFDAPLPPETLRGFGSLSDRIE